jgi:hypothetical protein
VTRATPDAERRTVVYWRHFVRFEEAMTLVEFETLKDLWEWGDCAIESIDGQEPFDAGMRWTWGKP